MRALVAGSLLGLSLLASCSPPETLLSERLQPGAVTQPFTPKPNGAAQQSLSASSTVVLQADGAGSRYATLVPRARAWLQRSIVNKP
jgi:hypothetical protein